MSAIAILLAVVLLALAALHAYWGFGGVWPGTDTRSCARTVAGFRNIDAMPGPGASFAVAAALAATALVALAIGGLLALPLPGLLVSAAALGATLVFAGRGIAGFTPAWRRLTPEQPFAALDRRYYSPLCLAMAAGFIALLANGPST